MTEDTINKAVTSFESGFNCSQSVFVAYAPLYGLDADIALRIGQPFGGGMGRSGEVCGAVSGALMALGLAEGNTDPENNEAKARVYTRASDFLKRFEARQETVLCRELLGVDIGTEDGLQFAREQDLFHQQCPAFVRAAAEILQEMLSKD